MPSDGVAEGDTPIDSDDVAEADGMYSDCVADAVPTLLLPTDVVADSDGM